MEGDVIDGARLRLDSLLTRLAESPSDAEAAYNAADLATDFGWEEEAIAPVALAARFNPRDARLWHMLAVLYRGVEDLQQAVAAFDRALAENPSSALSAYALAQATMEAGLPAVDRFDAALSIEPTDLRISLGRAAALAGIGEFDAATTGLLDRLSKEPNWVEGHNAFAKICAASGNIKEATASIDRAIECEPLDPSLRVTQLIILSRIATPQVRLDTAKASARLFNGNRDLAMQYAVAASEANEIAQADAIFTAIGKHNDHGFALAQLRHLVRSGRWHQAEGLAARLVAGPQGITAWAYRQIVWRATGDPRLDWLDRDGDLIRTYDLSATLPPLDQLTETLRSIHNGVAAPLDQSVRAGTQTDGPLFSRIDPLIQATRKAIRAIVKQHIYDLPKLDPDHPANSPTRRAEPRFSGAWSVRLLRDGHHVSHVHPAGWISSALYLALPTDIGQSGKGVLTIGEPPADLNVSLAPTQLIKPMEGQLTLFPSYTWHGVTPSPPGERLTIAFDVARPHGPIVHDGL